jgi:hypothetical protein
VPARDVQAAAVGRDVEVLRVVLAARGLDDLLAREGLRGVVRAGLRTIYALRDGVELADDDQS